MTPAFDKKITTYYYARGKYGMFDAPDGWTNSDLLSYSHFDRYPEDGDAGATEDTTLVRLRQAVKRAVKKNRGIVLGLDATLNHPWRRIINKTAKSFWTMPLVSPWDYARLIDLGDEPKWSTIEQTEKVLEVKAYLAEKQLAQPPIGSVFGYKDEGFKASREFNWVGLEAYLEPPGDQYSKPGEVYAAVRARLKLEALKRVSPAHCVVVVLQGYDRNGNFTNYPALVELQRQTIKVAFELFPEKLLGFLLFSYGREGILSDGRPYGGTRRYPDVQRIHEQLLPSAVVM